MGAGALPGSWLPLGRPSSSLFAPEVGLDQRYFSYFFFYFRSPSSLPRVLAPVVSVASERVNPVMGKFWYASSALTLGFENAGLADFATPRASCQQDVATFAA